MSESTSVQVNFGRPIPLFPLDGVTLLPQQILPLHIFEPRYKQMVTHALDGSGQIAMAVFAGKAWKEQYHGRPRLRRAVCLGQIAQHERLPDDRYNILLQGVCRARIVKEMPAGDEKLYREALLEPVGVDNDETLLDDVRSRLDAMLAEGPLNRIRVAEPILEYLRNPEIPTSAVMEIISFTILTDNIVKKDMRYQLLAEGDAGERARLIEEQLTDIRLLIEKASHQRPEDWPKGVSYN
jgi:Lon protease-like protein